MSIEKAIEILKEPSLYPVDAVSTAMDEIRNIRARAGLLKQKLVSSRAR